MCGFVCLWEIEDGGGTLLAAMLSRLGHRGPDATRIARLDDAPVAMGHCRLAIIGAEDGIQPIRADAEMLVANGEIYNHADLRAILGAENFNSSSDSEAILRLFRGGAQRWINRLDGMFAFVLATPERIVAARDPLGIKPLYMARRGKGLAFASELKAFDGFGFDDIGAVPPGTLFDSRAGLRTWYRIPAGAGAAEPGLDIDAVAGELRLALEEAVAKWMVADVEVGSFLSGGLDSSLVAAIAQKHRTGAGLGPLKTFAVGTAGAPDLLAARRVADHLGTEHHEFTFSAQDIADSLAHVVYHLESADLDLVRSAVPTLFAARLARRHVKAVLTGEGADELFAGYAYHHGYADDPRALADELTRSLGTMHNINLQRVDRMTMAQSLEARTPFLDRDLIAFAQSLPAQLKLRRTDPASAEATGPTTEKWLLRRACRDLLPEDLIWRRKAQFDEGSGTVEALRQALRLLTGSRDEVDPGRESKLYRDILRSRFAEPEMILAQAGQWNANRIAA
ncbi:asparagine synthase (glutamine-hydrolyzing) [Bosea minatitlanensis]|uniref:asparagine synthase (glutamine-hydrolyzing) n=1 Tax=Bosea minatitlanensis TaxID=128782 RepID=A0ABW0F2A6_9HYPH|nr:asparagine synthase (glutamine-hydrolyzing) [Bosea minatitlanensis]MCT4492584.1 asparagine synthase (glutamine-hydrolyzing) [Bosea minatitlanensis]